MHELVYKHTWPMLVIYSGQVQAHVNPVEILSGS